MEKIICFIYDDMADFELIFAAYLSKVIKKEIITVTYDGKMVTSRTGMQYQPHMSVKDSLNLLEVEGLIIPGGWNDEQRPELTQLIQRLNDEEKLLAAICAGPQFLAKAGVLDNKEYTTTLTIENLESQGKEDFFPRDNFVKKTVHRDGHVITAEGRAFVDFAIEIVDYFNAFSSEDEKETVRKHYKVL